jgi:hypothetical protein
LQWYSYACAVDGRFEPHRGCKGHLTKRIDCANLDQGDEDQEEPGGIAMKYIQIHEYCETMQVYPMLCPVCKDPHTCHERVEVFNRQEDADTGTHVTIVGSSVKVDKDVRDNPSRRRDGVRIYFTCEHCHHEINIDSPPMFQLLLIQHKGNTLFETVYYIEDKS